MDLSRKKREVEIMPDRGRDPPKPEWHTEWHTHNVPWHTQCTTENADSVRVFGQMVHLVH